MKSKLLCILTLAVGALGLTGCQATGTGTSTAIQTITNPNNLATAAQESVTVIATAVLARNPKLTATFVAAADALVAAASSNPGAISTSDVTSLLATAGLSTTDQEEIAMGVMAAQNVFLTAFKGANLPSLAPIYQLFMDAVANGIYGATGHAAVALPTVTIPPPAAAPAS